MSGNEMKYSVCLVTD